MSSNKNDTTDGMVQNYFLCAAQLRQAIKNKAAQMHVTASILTATILEAWLTHWIDKPVGIGEVDKTIVP
ncbi:MAG TPA: hypothetical protein VFV92_07405 [Candidatus Bathyarchaeia archaeon]|nr:hypothetical protein [Candidatus Bathyarchaeia archaeon]